MARKLEVLFIGETNSLDKAFATSEKKAGKWGKGLGSAAKVAGLGLTAGVGVAVVAIKDFAGAASEAEVSSTKMKTQLKALGISYSAHADQIDKVIKKTSALSGLDDEDLQDSFTNIVRVTGDVNEALKLNALAADFARAKNIDVAKAGELVGKVAGGNVGILSRYGITVKEGATATEALGLLQTKFAGQAEAYGKTAAGANDRFKVAIEGVKEALGAKLLPAITAVTNTVAEFITGLTDGSGTAGKFGDTVRTVWENVQAAVGKAVGFLKGVLVSHRDDIQNVERAARNVWTAMKFVWEESILPMLKRVLPAIQQVVKGAFDIIGGIIKTVSSLLTGDFGAAWDGVKQIFKGALEMIVGNMQLATVPIREAASKIGEGIVNALDSAWESVKSGVRSVLKWFGDRIDDFKKLAEAVAAPFVVAFGKIKDIANDVLDVFGKIVGAIKEVVEWIGKIKIPSIKIPGIGGFGGGNVGPGKVPATVDGFNDDAARFGNVVTSGFRPGDPGWHGRNRARDYAGGNMLGFAQYMAANFGGKLLELIHTPLGFGIKNGNKVPLSFWGGDVNADHYDHVHVALARGGHLRRGGWAVVGENGPELAHLPTGTSVYSNEQSRGMLGGAVTVLYATFDLGHGVTQAAQFVFDENGRQLKGAYRAGLA